MNRFPIILLFLLIILPVAAQVDTTFNNTPEKFSKSTEADPPKMNYVKLNIETVSSFLTETVDFAELDTGIELVKFKKRNLQDITPDGKAPSPMYLLNFICEKYDLEVESWNYARITSAQAFYSYLLKKVKD